eukprot:gnl/Dysnectes_brevis/7413_a12378_440.p2 GENE.gnl/Dysnectes_brevis/7413_a12378_440~~gnl/Dysnectes_brevis/7413_a12378_440.p2  ORF type:complete len:154 (+),score=1.75 gnl/Dysnectes_brevis/7413_a12378_440:102-563(+)
MRTHHQYMRFMTNQRLGMTLQTTNTCASMSVHIQTNDYFSFSSERRKTILATMFSGPPDSRSSGETVPIQTNQTTGRYNSNHTIITCGIFQPPCNYSPINTTVLDNTRRPMRLCWYVLYGSSTFNDGLTFNTMKLRVEVSKIMLDFASRSVLI